jgi:hypothetical protein
MVQFDEKVRLVTRQRKDEEFLICGGKVYEGDRGRGGVRSDTF